QNVADMVAISDGIWDGWYGIDGANFVTFNSGQCRIAGRHMDGASFVFCDGHAKWQANRNWKPSQWQTGWTP
ncbi:MAG TPA: H-X9-DG-CTERM domain-containing protein, partial [Armatimonadota bacterium]|nr:H-X9-DG-CTERM domain-containing protein [Armatimonadota bacterium]